MTRRNLSLTGIYGRVNDPSIVNDGDVVRVRDLHRELDMSLLATYGWSDVRAEHGVYSYKQVLRWTLDPDSQSEVMDRLLEENNRRTALRRDSKESPHNW